MPSRNNRKASSTKSNNHKKQAPKIDDVYHNNDHPNCLLLEQQAQNVMDSCCLEGQTEASSSSSFYRLLRDHLLTTTTTTSTTTNGNGSTKRNKKKKKKKKQPSPSQQDAPVPSLVESSNSSEPSSPPTTKDDPSPQLSLPLQQQASVQRNIDNLLQQCLATSSANATVPGPSLSEFLMQSQSPALQQAVPATAVQEGVAQIACPNCQKDAQAVLDHHCPSIPLRGVFMQTEIDPNQVEEDSYILMEEGVAVQNGGGCRFVQQPQNDNNKDYWILEGPSDRVRFLLQHHLILLGLSPDVLHRRSTASAAALDRSDQPLLDQSVASQTGDLAKDYLNMANQLFLTTKKFQSTAQHDQSESDFKYLSSMKQSDAELDVVLDTLERILFRVSRAGQACVCQIRQSSVWIVPTVEQLWKVYLGGLHRILQGVGKFHAQLFACANQTGSLPVFFSSVQARSLYRSLVETKLHTVRQVMEETDGLLQQKTHIGDWGAHDLQNYQSCLFVRRLFYEEAYLHYLWHKTYVARPPSLTLDTAFEDVLTTIRELTAATELAPKADKSLQPHTERLEKLSRLCYTVSVNVSNTQQQKDGKVGGNPHLIELGNTIDSLSFASTEVDFETKTQHVNQARIRLTQGVIAATMHWIRYKSKLDRVPHAPAMPYALRRQIRVDAFGRCSGGNGSLRVASILVGLYVQQMARSFQEWQAQMAADELLTVLQDDEAKAAKKSKKKKGKKEKAQSKPQGNQEEAVCDENRPVASIANDESQMTDKDQAFVGGDPPESNGKANQVPVADDLSLDRDAGNSKTCVVDEEKGVATQESDTASREASSQTTESGKGVVAHDYRIVVGETAAGPRVGVETESGFQSAESFFVSRLEEVLNSGEDIIYA